MLLIEVIVVVLKEFNPDRAIIQKVKQVKQAQEKVMRMKKGDQIVCR